MQITESRRGGAGVAAQTLELNRRVFEFRFELVDAIFLQPQLALEQLALRVLLPATAQAGREEEREQKRAAPEIHFGPKC